MQLMEGYHVNALQMNHMSAEEAVAYGRHPNQPPPPPPHIDGFSFHPLVDCEPTLQIG